MTENNPQPNPRVGKALIFASIAFTYAVIRYCVCGPVDWSQIPSYIANKASAVGAVFYFLMTVLAHRNQDGAGTRYWGKLTTCVVIAHVLLSFGMFSSEYYPKFYHDNHLTFGGNLLLAAGVAGLVMMVTFGQWTQIATQRMVTISILASLHVIPMGIPGWFKPSTWHGYLPPISLISFLISATAFGVLVLVSIKQKQRADSTQRQSSLTGESYVK